MPKTRTSDLICQARHGNTEALELLRPAVDALAAIGSVDPAAEEAIDAVRRLTRFLADVDRPFVAPDAAGAEVIARSGLAPDA